MTSPSRRILVTTALPYANGDIHLGHLLGYIQADIWTRFHRMRGAECWHVCADDAHGAPVMLRAEGEGIPAEELIGRMRAAHMRDFAAFYVDFHNYHTTHSPENEALAVRIYRALRENNLITERPVVQLYDPKKGMFLPDRYVRGECPKCSAADQYGDSCEECGSVYAPTELKNPRSTVSGAKPEPRESLHCFFNSENSPTNCSSGLARKSPTPPAPEKKPPACKKRPPTSCANGLPTGCGTGTSPATRRISAFAFPTAKTKNTFMSGWTRPSDTWPVFKTCATAWPKPASRRAVCAAQV